MRATTSMKGHAVRTASRLLRGMADRLEPPHRAPPPPGQAPLVRFGGHWWPREELLARATRERTAAADVQLLP